MREVPDSSSNEAFVEGCLRHFLGRESAGDEGAALVKALASGRARQDVIRELSSRPEAVARAERFLANRFAWEYDAGHYYSPVPAAGDAPSNDGETPRSIPGIDLNERVQVRMLDDFWHYFPEQPFKRDETPGRRYYADNDFYPAGDAILLYSFLRRFRPRRVVEIGSGFSSAAMLDVDELFLGGNTSFTFIDPHPERLLSRMSEGDRARHTLLRSPLQEAPRSLFEQLAENDLLFIDSSHVAKIGSDVVHYLSSVLPALRPGVLVHFHDIFWPFEYPDVWIRQGRAWNEAYLLRAFLSFNDRFEIVCFFDWLRRHMKDELKRTVPLLLEVPGGSLWIRRTR